MVSVRRREIRRSSLRRRRRRRRTGRFHIPRDGYMTSLRFFGKGPRCTQLQRATGSHWWYTMTLLRILIRLGVIAQ